MKLRHFSLAMPFAQESGITLLWLKSSRNSLYLWLYETKAFLVDVIISDSLDTARTQSPTCTRGR